MRELIVEAPVFWAGAIAAIFTFVGVLISGLIAIKKDQAATTLDALKIIVEKQEKEFLEYKKEVKEKDAEQKKETNRLNQRVDDLQAEIEEVRTDNDGLRSQISVLKDCKNLLQQENKIYEISYRQLFKKAKKAGLELDPPPIEIAKKVFVGD